MLVSLLAGAVFPMQVAAQEVPQKPAVSPALSEEAVLRAAFAFPWAATTPIQLFYDYILPDTFIDEEARPWRAEIFKRFAPLARECRTRREAILRIAAECEKRCGTIYSTKRRAANQCAAESLESGLATCTGLSILLAGAYRAVGIPARLAQVAEWGDRGGNHTWVEVWDDDGWHFIEYYPDAKGLDHGWLLEPCARLDPANPLSRVVARVPVGSAPYWLSWSALMTSLPGEDRTAHYRKLADAAGIKPILGARTELVIIGAATPETRVPRPFRVLDAAGREIAKGMTPGSRDDANNAPRIVATPGHSYTVEITQPDGKATRTTIVPGPKPAEVK